ncbi:uncharacterized protein LOC126588211 [Malus sylvestris]|uniref:uncharacterized protein LOC126588211 n=1 Tax=Malus sylvestris TaxID=3752 RepID=UPI0021AD1356|nr:uncharacterized protein LOC126588211 [Malus sylvestris]
MSTPTRKRLMRDFKRLQQNPPARISGVPQDGNVMLSMRLVNGKYMLTVTTPRPKLNLDCWREKLVPWHFEVGLWKIHANCYHSQAEAVRSFTYFRMNDKIFMAENWSNLVPFVKKMSTNWGSSQKT